MPAVEAGDVVWRIGADMSDLDAAIAQSQTNIQRGFEAASRQVGIAMTAMGAAITGALAVSANAAIDWETAFTGVLKTVDGTEIEMAALADGIRDMAKEIPVAATELAAFAEIGGQMGVPRDQILGFTKVIAILAETTNIAGEEGAAMLAQFATVAQVPQSEYSNLAAAIVDLGNAGTSTEADILAMGQRLAAAGTIAGLTSGDILGIANSLVGVGIEAEAGGTAFSKVFIDMTNSVKSGDAQLTRLAEVAGMSAQQFADAFNTDPAAAIVAFVQGLARIDAEGGNVFTTLDKLDYTEIRLRNSLLSSALAADGMAASVRLGNEAFAANNAHLVEAEKRFATTASQIQLAKNALWDLSVVIGDVMLPGIAMMTGWIRTITDQISAFAQANPALTQTLVMVAAAIGAAMLVLGPLLIALPGLAVAFTAITSVSWPFIAGIAAIGGALFALGLTVYNFLSTWSGWGALWDWIGGVVEAARGWLTANWEQIVTIFNIAKENLILIGGILMQAISNAMQVIGGVLQAFFGETVAGFGYLAEGTGEGTTTTLDFIQNMMVRGTEFLMQMSQAFGAFSAWMDQHWSTIQSIMDWGVWAVLNPLFFMVDKMLWVWDQVRWIAGGIMEALAWLFGGAGQFAGNVNISGPTGLATGGTVEQAGWALVGERGPELVNLPAGSTVYDSQQTAQARGGAQAGSSNSTVNVYLSGTFDLSSRDASQRIGQMIADETAARLRSAGAFA